MKMNNQLQNSKVAYLSFILILMLITLSGCGSKNKEGSDSTFTWWISRGVDTNYFGKYEDNPCVKYLMSKSWGENKTSLSLDFRVPVSGAESDNFITLLNTDAYADIMEMSMYGGSIVELYEDGIIMDLTEYVDKYMPNYKAVLEMYPEIKQSATNLVNGEKKYLQIYTVSQAPGVWGGYMYRRDWIVKYGKNPIDGSAFYGECKTKNDDGSWNADSWEDNVIFPNGSNEPIYISDWEWMFEIFDRAIKDQNISDGYCLSLFYPGYIETGDLVSAFGGGGGGFYKNPEGKIVFGPGSDNFRTYLQAMNQWYKNGWIDKAFPEHAADMFYEVDDAKVRQGKVGLWYGQQSQILGNMQGVDPLTKDIMVFAAKQPINDIYGSDAQKYVTPYCMYQAGREGASFCVASRASEKDLEALFSMIDYLYSIEGGTLKTFGLSKDQIDEIEDTFYPKYGLTNGAYYAVEDEEGTKYVADPIIDNDGSNILGAVILERMPGLVCSDLFGVVPDAVETGNNYLDTFQNDMWLVYENVGWLSKSITSQLSPELTSEFNKINTNVTTFLKKHVPDFIKGNKDPNSDADWQAFLSAINKYNPDRNTQIYQELLDNFID